MSRFEIEQANGARARVVGTMDRIPVAGRLRVVGRVGQR